MGSNILSDMPTRIFVGLSFGSVLLIGILYFTDRQIFRRFLGNLDPLIVIVAVVLLGILLMLFLRSNGWFAIYTHNLRGLLIACGLGILLSSIMMVYDHIVVLPENINVPFPQSLLFYPAIGYVAEILFHLLPLSLLLALLPRLLPQVDLQWVVWFSILMVSLVEAVYQASDIAGQYSFWAVAYMGLHLFVFGVIQLSLFKRYGFITMYTCRLAYYAVWHIVWGYLRLQRLF